jgi:hypothetical protein
MQTYKYIKYKHSIRGLLSFIRILTFAVDYIIVTKTNTAVYTFIWYCGDGASEYDTVSVSTCR